VKKLPFGELSSALVRGEFAGTLAQIEIDRMSDDQHPSATRPVRQAGLAVPVFSLRRDGDLGIGDVVALRELVDWCADLQIGFVQLLPINETGSDNSPYNAISSVALEPMTLDCSPGEASLMDLPEAEYDKATSAAGVDELRRGPVKYDRVRALKLDLLWRAFLGFLENHCQQGTERDEDFHSFCEAEADWLGDYCLFRLLMDMEGGNQNWQTWSEDCREIDSAKKFLHRLLEVETVNTERQLMFYAYVQWVAFQQWREVRRHADERGVALMGDVPIGVSFCSADVFANPAIFDLDWYGGAPPETNFKDDEFTMKWGQNWGIPLYRWDVMEKKDDFAWWRRRVSKVCEIFSMFRVDHALGFYRIYAFPWNPVRNEEFLPLNEGEAAERTGGRLPGFKERPDDSEENCAANCRDGEKYLRVLDEAAGDAEVIAEDLGVVPDYVRPSLEKLGIPGMKVPHWEYNAATGQPVSGSEYTEVSFATWATHDHDPLRVQWEHNRVVLSEAASHPPAESDHDAQGVLHSARSFMSAMQSFAGVNTDDGPDGGPPPYGDSVRESLLSALLASNSRHAGVMITDMLGLEDRINVPGVLGENWVWRMESSVDDLRNNPHWRYLGEQFKKLLLESGRISNFTESSPSVSATVGLTE
jgi:4-alpha-glucanotransferase